MHELTWTARREDTDKKNKKRNAYNNVLVATFHLFLLIDENKKKLDEMDRIS